MKFVTNHVFLIICCAILIGYIIMGILGYDFSADSGEKSQSQPQELVGETAIIREYDKNENLINEWRVKK